MTPPFARNGFPPFGGLRDPELRLAIVQARDLARSAGEDHIAPEHLLLGLLTNVRGEAFGLLDEHGLTFAQAQEALAAQRVQADAEPRDAESATDDPAGARDDDTAGPSAYDDDKEALARLGIDLDSVRAAVQENLGEDIAEGWAMRRGDRRSGRRRDERRDDRRSGRRDDHRPEDRRHHHHDDDEDRWSGWDGRWSRDEDGDRDGGRRGRGRGGRGGGPDWRGFGPGGLGPRGFGPGVPDAPSGPPFGRGRRGPRPDGPRGPWSRMSPELEQLVAGLRETARAAAAATSQPRIPTGTDLLAAVIETDTPGVRAILAAAGDEPGLRDALRRRSMPDAAQDAAQDA